MSGRAYHHGDLRAALIEASFDLLAECGLTVVRSASNLFAHCVTVLPEGADQGFGSSAA